MKYVIGFYLIPQISGRKRVFLSRVCQCGLHSVLWSHSGTLPSEIGTSVHCAAEHAAPQKRKERKENMLFK